MEDREDIAGALTEIFVSSLTMCKASDDCIVANVVPLFRKGWKNKLEL